MPKRVTPITPLPGVPDNLIQVLNSRFRELTEAPAPQTVITRISSNGGGGGGGAIGGPRSEPVWATDFVYKSVDILDGALHQLGDVYTALSDAQKDYPFATDLTQSIAWAAIQKAIYTSSYVYLPIGSYFINWPFDCTNKQYGGLHFYGAGQQNVVPRSWSDLAIDASDPTKIRSAAQPFKPWQQWSTLKFTGGAGFTLGTVLITSVAADGTATCATSAGTAGSTGGQATSTTGCGSRIVAATGGVVFDFSGTGQITLHDFMVDGAAVPDTSNFSTVGMLFGRTYEQPDAESSLVFMQRIVIQMRELTRYGIGANECLNGGQNLGSIAVLNWCSENMTLEHCYFQADRSYIGQHHLPMNITDDYPMLVDSDSVWHGQPLRFFLPVSPYSLLYGGDLATPVHITDVSIAGGTITYTTTEDLGDPALFYTRPNPSTGNAPPGTGWFTGAAATVRGLTGLSAAANITTRAITVIDSHHFSAPVSGTITGGYGGGGTAFLNTWYSEGVVTVVSCAFIGMRGPCLTLGGVTMFLGLGIYTLSYHDPTNPDTPNPNMQAAYQFADQCMGVHITGASEMESRIVYSRFYLFDFRFDVDAPHDPDSGVARVWLDGQLSDGEGGVFVPGIEGGSVRVNPVVGTPHYLIEGNSVLGTVSCKATLAASQGLQLPAGQVNVQVEHSDNWAPQLPTAYGGVFDFSTHWGRRVISGPLTVTGPLFATPPAALNFNGVMGPDTDAQISMVDADGSGNYQVHTFGNHGMVDGQLITVFGVVGVTPSVPITKVACHVVDAKTVTIPGVTASGTYLAGGTLRAADGKDSLLSFFDGGIGIWSAIKARAGSFSFFDQRVGRTAAIFDRDFMIIGANAMAYTDLVIGADPTTVSSAAHPFYDPLAVGMTLNVTGGSGFIVQSVTIVSVNGTLATCSASLGTPGSTGGTARQPFFTEILADTAEVNADVIVIPKQAAAAGTYEHLAVDQYGIIYHRTKGESQGDLGITGGGGGMADPTTMLGDLIVRGATAPDRLKVGTDGQILSADSTQTLGVKWVDSTSLAGADQTPWLQDIDGRTYTLNTTGVVRAAACFGIDKDSTGAWNNLVAIRPFDVLFAAGGGTLTRWDINRTGTELGDGSGTGANANTGSDLMIFRYSDPGNYLGPVITFIRKTGFVGVNMPNPSFQLHVKSPSGVIAIRADTGYIWSDGGFNSPEADPAAVNIPNGGATFGLGVAVMQGFYMHGQSLSALNAPAANYGGLAFAGGTSYAYWDGGANAWTAFDFKLVGSQTPWRSDIDGHGFSLTGANEVAASAGVFAGTNTDTVAIRPTDILIANSPAQTRWDISKVGAETGTPTSPTNVGSDLYFYRYNDAGNYLGQVLILIRQTGFVGINMPNPSSQLQVKAAAAANVAIHADTGYVLSDAGFNTPSSDPQALNVAAGGGIFGLGIAIGQGVYPKANTITALNAPAATYGGLGYVGGSTYAYYDNTSGSAGWKSIDFKGASQSPWLTDINGNGKSLNGALSVNVTGAGAGCTVTTGADEVIVGATAIAYYTGANARWWIEKEDSEGANNAGGNLHISRWGVLIPPGTGNDGTLIDVVLALVRSNGFVGIGTTAPANKLHVANGVCQSDNGFYTPSSSLNAIQAPNGAGVFGIGVSVTGSSWNSIQSSGGIRVSGALQAGPDFPTSPDPGALPAGFLCFLKGGGTSVVATVMDGYGSIPAVIGRAAGGSPGGETPPGNGAALLALSGRGATGANTFTGSGAAQIVLITSEAWGSNNNGADIIFQTTPNGSSYGGRQNRMYIRNSGLLEIAGIGATSAGVLLDVGFFQANQGFYASGTAISVFNAPNGGASIGVAIYLGQQGGAPPNPLANYGGLGWKGGSTYWYWNGTTFLSVDFSTVGAAIGVTHLNGIAGDVSLVQGSNVAISPNVPVPGQITISVQANPTFGTVTAGAYACSAASGSTAPLAFYLTTAGLFSVDGNGILNCRGINVGGNFCTDNTGIWAGGVQGNNLVLGSQFGIYGQFTGGTASIQISVPGGTRTLNFQGGLFKSVTSP